MTIKGRDLSYKDETLFAAQNVYHRETSYRLFGEKFRKLPNAALQLKN